MRVWEVARGVAWRTLHNVLTTPSLLIPGLLFPLFFFTAFAGGLSQVSEVPGFDYEGDYTSFQFVFVLLQSAAFGGVFTGFGIASENDAPRAAKAHVLARAFLAVDMTCARCHDAPFHPFEQADLFGLAGLLDNQPQKIPATSTQTLHSASQLRAGHRRGPLTRASPMTSAAVPRLHKKKLLVISQL